MSASVAVSPPNRWVAPVTSIIKPSGGSVGDHRRIAAQQPQRQPIEGQSIGRRLGVVNHQSGHQGLRHRCRHAGIDTEITSRSIRGNHNALAALATDQDQWNRISRIPPLLQRSRRHATRRYGADDRSATSADRARRPCSSQASTTKSAHSPALARINSTSQRGRPMPDTGSGTDGKALTRQRVTLAVGLPEVRGFGHAPPAPDGDRRCARGFGDQLQADATPPSTAWQPRRRHRPCCHAANPPRNRPAPTSRPPTSA